MKYKKIVKRIIFTLLLLFISGQLIIYMYVDIPLSTDFYSSIPKALVQERQVQYGVKYVLGNGWVHLGWISDPDNEEYTIEIESKSGNREHIGTTQFGSFLYRGNGGLFKVVKINKKTRERFVVGTAKAYSINKKTDIYKPIIAGNYRPLYKPEK
ncbi:MAG TPA: hypothetical protein PL059_14405, partial [Spirochaetota bacterium]|nr:hypothetical protein [Spirochaetota bacterium]